MCTYVHRNTCIHTATLLQKGTGVTRLSKHIEFLSGNYQKPLKVGRSGAGTGYSTVNILATTIYAREQEEILPTSLTYLVISLLRLCLMQPRPISICISYTSKNDFDPSGSPTSISHGLKLQVSDDMPAIFLSFYFLRQGLSVAQAKMTMGKKLAFASENEYAQHRNSIPGHTAELSNSFLSPGWPGP